jgi:hypothetical protein
MYKPFTLLVVFASLITSCSGSESGSNDFLRLGVTPNLAFLQQEIYACSATMPGHVQVEVSPMGALTFGEYTAIFHAGQAPRDSVFSTQVGDVKLNISINPGNPVSQMDRDDLVKVLLGIQTDWQVIAPQSFTQPTPIHVWSYPAGDDIRDVVEKYLLDGRLITATSNLAPDGQAMLAAVLGDPLAIGYIVDEGHGIPMSTTPAAPKTVYTLQEPILASFGASPEGTVRELILCLSKSGG